MNSTVTTYSAEAEDCSWKRKRIKKKCEFCEKFEVHIKSPKRKGKSKTRIEAPKMKKISKYFTPSPKKSEGNDVFLGSSSKKEVPVIKASTSGNSRKSTRKCIKFANSPNKDRTSKDINYSQNKKKQCGSIEKVKVHLGRGKSKTHLETPKLRDISSYFIPSPKRSNEHYSLREFSNKEESPVILNPTSKSNRKCYKSKSSKNASSIKVKTKLKTAMKNSKTQEITNYFTPSPKKSTTSSLSNEDELPIIKKTKSKSNNENFTGKSNENVSSSYQKYGICMPSYEDILLEWRNCENYKKIVENLTELVTPLPDVNKFEVDKETRQPSSLDCKGLSTEELRSAFKNNVKYLDDIYYENTFCKRHELYKRSARSDLTFNTSMILFTNEQKQILASKLSKRYGNSSNDYYFQVLLPELCLKIFMDKFSVTLEEASKYLEERPVEI